MAALGAANKGRTLLKGIAGIAGLVGGFYFSGNEWAYKKIFMPCLHLLEAERAHVVAVKAAKYGLVPFCFERDPPELHCRVWDHQLTNPLGIAAGFDKHGEAVSGLLGAGFGLVEVGSVTPLPQEGNPRPRVFRLAEDRALINRYGFNSAGLVAVEERLKSWKASSSKGQRGLLGANLGKNKHTENAASDYVQGVKSLGPHVDYLVVNVSSPNTPGLRDYQKFGALKDLIRQVVAERDKLKHRPPLLVKISPDLSARERQDVAAVVTAASAGVDGIVVTNTTLSRPAGLSSPHSEEAGGLSGQPLKDLSVAAIHDMYRLTEGKMPIIGVGGVSSGQDAFDAICAGASLVQIYTALVYHGPTLVPKLKKELAVLLREKGYNNVSEAVGSDHKAK